jgi:hypothetical protein
MFELPSQTKIKKLVVDRKYAENKLSKSKVAQLHIA